MSTWYQASMGRIEEVEVISETEKFVTLKTRFGSTPRSAKESEWQWICKTREEAKQKLIASCRLQIEQSERRLKHFQTELTKLEAL